MKEFVKNNIPLIKLVFCSGVIATLLYLFYQSDSVFAVFVFGGFGIYWLYLFYKLIEISKRAFGERSWFRGLFGISLSIFSLLPVFSIYNFYNSKLSVPDLFAAKGHGVYAHFKMDGTYVIKSGPWGTKNYYYGKYQFEDSTVKLDRSNFDDVLSSNTLRFRRTSIQYESRRPEYDRVQSEVFLVPIDRFRKDIRARCILDDCMPFRFEVLDSRNEVLANMWVDTIRAR